MMNFTFNAPALFEAGAFPSPNESIHDASEEVPKRLVKIKKFVGWLKTEMQRDGLPVKAGLDLDSSGWVFEVGSNKGFVMCFVSNLDGDETSIELLVTEMGGAAEGIDRAVEALLSRSSEITDLKVQH